MIPVPLPVRAQYQPRWGSPAGVSKTPRAYEHEPQIITKESLGLGSSSISADRNVHSTGEVVVGRSVDMPEGPLGGGSVGYSAQLNIETPDNVSGYHL